MEQKIVLGIIYTRSVGVRVRGERCYGSSSSSRQYRLAMWVFVWLNTG